MENPEEILHSLEEFSKLKPKDIPRELEEYLCFVAKTGDPVYQWAAIKNLFREKLINVITEFYETCPSVEIPPCPNVEVFNYENMKSFILEKLETFAAAPFTVQRICELLTAPRKEYNRIDKYMRALEKNILVVSTVEPGGNRRANHENADGTVNGLESEHAEGVSANKDINVEEMDDMPTMWPRMPASGELYESTSSTTSTAENGIVVVETQKVAEDGGAATVSAEDSPSFSIVEAQASSSTSASEDMCGPTLDSSFGSICTVTVSNEPYVSIEPVVAADSCLRQEGGDKPDDVSITITAIPKRRSSTEQTVAAESSTEDSESENIVAQSSSSEQSEAQQSSSQLFENVDSTSSSTSSVEDKPQEEQSNNLFDEAREQEELRSEDDDNKATTTAIVELEVCENANDCVVTSAEDALVTEATGSNEKDDEISNSDGVESAHKDLETPDNETRDESENVLSKDVISSSSEEIASIAAPSDVATSSVTAEAKEEELIEESKEADVVSDGSSSSADISVVVDSTRALEEMPALPEEELQERSETAQNVVEESTPMEVDEVEDDSKVTEENVAPPVDEESGAEVS